MPLFRTLSRTLLDGATVASTEQSGGALPGATMASTAQSGGAGGAATVASMAALPPASPNALRPVSQCLADIRAHITPLEEVGENTTLVPLSQARGRQLASDFFAPYAIPRWPTSIMDGYSFHYEAHFGHAGLGDHADLREHNISIPVLDAARDQFPGMRPLTGDAKAKVSKQFAQRVTTGALLAEGHDTVVPFEEVVEEVVVEETEKASEGVLEASSSTAGDVKLERKRIRGGQVYGHRWRSRF